MVLPPLALIFVIVIIAVVGYVFLTRSQNAAPFWKSLKLPRLGRRRPASTVTVIQNEETIEAPAPTLAVETQRIRRRPHITAAQIMRRRNLAIVVAILIGFLALSQVPRLVGAQSERFIVLIAPFRDSMGDAAAGNSVAQQFAAVLNDTPGLTVHTLSTVPDTLDDALAYMDAQNADALVLGDAARGEAGDQVAVLPVLVYRPTGTFTPAGWDGYTSRFAQPLVYQLASAPLADPTALAALLTALNDYGAGRFDRAYNSLGSALVAYPALRPELPHSLRGNILWASARYEAAAAEYQRALALASTTTTSPELAQLANNYGAILQDAGRPDAISAFNQAVQLLGDRDLGQLRVNLGIRSLREGQPAAAIQSLEQAKNLLPPSAPLFLTLAASYRANNQFQDARDALQAAAMAVTRDDRSLPQPWPRLVEMRVDANLNEQRGLLQLAQALDARDPLFWELLSGGLQPRDAISADTLGDVRNVLQTAVNQTDELVQRWRLRSAAQDAADEPTQAEQQSVSDVLDAGDIATGQAQRAEAALRERLRLLAAMEIEIARAQGYKPPEGLAAFWTGVLGDRSPVGWARTYLQRLVEPDVGDFEAYIHLGRAELLVGNRAAADQAFTRADQIRAQRPEPVYGKALITLADPDTPTAPMVELLREAITRDGRFFPARESLANIAESEGNWQVAVEQRRALAEAFPTTERQLQLAVALRMNGPQSYAEAEAVLLPLANANNPEALLELGQLYRASGDETAAEIVLQRARTIAPTNAQVAYQLGQVYEAQGKDAEARGQYRLAVDSDPSFVDAHLALAATYDDPNSPEARRSYNNAIAAGLNDPAKLNQIGDVLMRHGEYDAAESAYQRAIDAPQAPTNELAASYHGLGQLLLLRGNIDDAEEAEQRALDIRNQNYPEALVGLGEVALARGDLVTAKQRFEAAQQQNPQLASAAIGLGRVPAAENNWGAALEYFRDAVARDPASPEAHLWLGEALIRTNQLPEATAAYSDAIRLNDDYAPAYFGLAQVQLAEDTPELALDTVNDALDRRANYAEAYLLKGKIQERLGQPSDAVEAYSKAIETNSRLEEPYYRRALLYLQDGHVGEARNDLEQAIAIRANYPEAHFWLGRAYMIEKDPVKAEEAFKRAASQPALSDEARYYQALAAQQLRQPDGVSPAPQAEPAQRPARSWFDSVVDLFNRIRP